MTGKMGDQAQGFGGGWAAPVPLRVAAEPGQAPPAPRLGLCLASASASGPFPLSETQTRELSPLSQLFCCLVEEGRGAGH